MLFGSIHARGTAEFEANTTKCAAFQEYNPLQIIMEGSELYRYLVIRDRWKGRPFYAIEFALAQWLLRNNNILVNWLQRHAQC